MLTEAEAREVLALRAERDFQQTGWLEALAREREWFKERDALRESLRWALGYVTPSAQVGLLGEDYDRALALLEETSHERG